MRRLLLLLPLLLTGAGAGADLPGFDSARAWEHLLAQCRFGPRVPGSEAHARALAYLEQTLRGTGGDVSVHRFEVVKPGRAADTLRLANVTARFGPAGRSVLLGAHWDSRPTSEKDEDPRQRGRPILGANDGASGVAVLLVLAELMGRLPPPFPVEIVLFDGEDQGLEGAPASYALGSREHAGRLLPPAPRAVVVIDMVGGRDLHICREANSEGAAPWLNDLLFSRAATLGLWGFEDRVCYGVYDDHVPFLERMIPAVDLVDMHYPQWHTQQDVPDACSRESLAQVGTLLVDFLYGGVLH